MTTSESLADSPHRPSAFVMGARDSFTVLGAAGRRLGEQLREAPTWRQRFTLLDRFLLGRLEAGPRPAPEVDRAWERLVTTGGAAPIAQLAGEVGWSQRVLGRLDARQRLDWGLVARRPRTWHGHSQPIPTASNRSIPFKTPWPPPSSLAGGNLRFGERTWNSAWRARWSW